MATQPTRWERDGLPAAQYAEHFRALAAEGRDLHGEARMVDAVAPRNARILDAGCGTGRLAAELAIRGHQVTAADKDPQLLEYVPHAAGLEVVQLDLTELDHVEHDELGAFDIVVAAGNVLVFLAPGTEARAVAAMAARLRADGLLIAGFATDRHYGRQQLDADATAAGLRVEHHFATWQLRPWDVSSGWLVACYRRIA